MKKTKKTNSTGPFTHVKRMYSSSPSFSGDEGYVPFIINKEISKDPNLVGLVNYIQQFQLPNNLHFKVLSDFAKYSPQPRFNQFPWIWGKQSKDDPTVSAIARHFEVSLSEARDYLKLLNMSSKGKEEILYLQRIYGLKNK